MNIFIYDPDKDGKVNVAEVADRLSSEAGAIYPTVYAKLDENGCRFASLTEIEPLLMLKSVYDRDNDGTVDNSLKADKLAGIDDLVVMAEMPGYVYGKAPEPYGEGFWYVSKIDPNIMMSGRYTTIFKSKFKPENITILEENVPENFLMDYCITAENSVDTSFLSSYINTNVMNTPKKGYSYVLTGKTYTLKTELVDENYNEHTDEENVDLEKYKKQLPVSTYYWSGWNGLHGVKTRIASNMAVSQNVETLLNWSKADHNSEDLWSSTTPSRFTIPSADSVDTPPNKRRPPMEWCRLSFNIKFLESASSGGIRKVIVKKNNTVLKDFPYIQSAKTDNIETNICGCSGPIRITNDDYFTLSVIHTSGGTLTLDAGASYFSLELI